MINKPKLLRIATVATSLDILLKGQLRFLQGHFEVKALSGLDDQLVMVQKREGVEVIDLPMSRKINIVNDIVSFFRLYYAFRKENPP